ERSESVFSGDDDLVVNFGLAFCFQTGNAEESEGCDGSDSDDFGEPTTRDFEHGDPPLITCETPSAHDASCSAVGLRSSRIEAIAAPGQQDLSGLLGDEPVNTEPLRKSLEV